MEKVLRMIERRCVLSAVLCNQSFSRLFLGLVLRFYMAFPETLMLILIFVASTSLSSLIFEQKLMSYYSLNEEEKCTASFLICYK